ncbi:unnamed protein product, partial [Amoebophrya sp. A25]
VFPGVSPLTLWRPRAPYAFIPREKVLDLLHPGSMSLVQTKLSDWEFADDTVVSGLLLHALLSFFVWDFSVGRSLGVRANRDKTE